MAVERDDPVVHREGAAPPRLRVGLDGQHPAMSEAVVAAPEPQPKRRAHELDRLGQLDELLGRWRRLGGG